MENEVEKLVEESRSALQSLNLKCEGTLLYETKNGATPTRYLCNQIVPVVILAVLRAIERGEVVDSHNPVGSPITPTLALKPAFKAFLEGKK